MKVLTIKSPWAQHIIWGGKNIENRTWATSYRGSLLIHVSRLPYTPVSGQIIGVVDLIDCLPPDNLFTAGNQWAEPGYYHWIVTNPRELKNKISVRGQLSLWEYPLENKDLKWLI